MKPQLYYYNDHYMYMTDYEPKKAHKHLASHLVFALDGQMKWNIAGEEVICRGIYIDANAEHVCMGNSRFLSFLFVKTSDYAYTIEQKMLKDKAYAVFGDDIVDKVLLIVSKYQDQPDIIDKEIIETCFFPRLIKRNYDKRVKDAINYIDEIAMIGSDIIITLANNACLSKSRFSHLFKEETQMTMASYLAFEKMRKTSHYLHEGYNITDSCMRAGFDSPSHCAATCKRMFGISLKKIAFI